MSPIIGVRVHVLMPLKATNLRKNAIVWCDLSCPPTLDGSQWLPVGSNNAVARLQIAPQIGQEHLQYPLHNGLTTAGAP